MRLDHISYACTTSELADVIQRIGGDLGATFVDGGRHPSFGTRNFILPLANGCYIEVVSALDHPAAEKAPFGRAVAERAKDGGGWMSWVVAVDDIAPIEARIGREARDGHRIRPDGTDLCWRQIGVLDVMDDPQLPFFVQWSSPAADHPPPAAPRSPSSASRCAAIPTRSAPGSAPSTRCPSTASRSTGSTARSPASWPSGSPPRTAPSASTDQHKETLMSAFTPVPHESLTWERNVLGSEVTRLRTDGAMLTVVHGRAGDVVPAHGYSKGSVTYVVTGASRSTTPSSAPATPAPTPPGRATSA